LLPREQLESNPDIQFGGHSDVRYSSVMNVLERANALREAAALL